MDFLPGAWLVRVDDIHASMTMGQPFPGIWLPRDMNVHAGVSLAAGPFEASYARQVRELQAGGGEVDHSSAEDGSGFRRFTVPGAPIGDVARFDVQDAASVAEPRLLGNGQRR